MLLETHITVDYPNRAGVLRDFDLAIAPGEITGLIGESGSGKSTLALALLRLLDHKGARCRGRILFEDRDLLAAKEREMRCIRGRSLALILQSPLSALNPMLRIGSHLREAWTAHSSDRDAWKPATLPLLERVYLPATEEFLRRYPREISVGQAQRVLIAMALLHRPRLLIADEPTSALDVITQAGILALFREINAEFGVAILVISHDLLSVAALCSQVAILESGAIVERGPVRDIFEQPRHPYTRRLIQALPHLPWIASDSSARLPASQDSFSLSLQQLTRIG